jgi:hypothetical protein
MNLPSRATTFGRMSFLDLHRELENTSLKMRPVATSDEAPRLDSIHTGQHEEHGRNGPDILAFTRDFKLAWDQFRVRSFLHFNYCSEAG